MVLTVGGVRLFGDSKLPVGLNVSAGNLCTLLSPTHGHRRSSSRLELWSCDCGRQGVGSSAGV